MIRLVSTGVIRTAMLGIAVWCVSISTGVFANYSGGTALLRLNADNQAHEDSTSFLDDFRYTDNARFGSVVLGGVGSNTVIDQAVIMSDNQILAVGGTYDLHLDDALFSLEYVSTGTIMRFSADGQLLGTLQHNIGSNRGSDSILALTNDNKVLVGGNISTETDPVRYSTYVRRFFLEP